MREQSKKAYKLGLSDAEQGYSVNCSPYCRPFHEYAKVEESDRLLDAHLHLMYLAGHQAYKKKQIKACMSLLVIVLIEIFLFTLFGWIVSKYA